MAHLDRPNSIEVISPVLPSLSIEPVQILEGNYGYLPVSFKVNLSEPSSDEISFEYRTLHGTSDAFDFSGSLGAGIGKIAAGETSTLITVYVDGDYDDEADESFFLELFNPANARLEGSEQTLRATGIIEDNDGSGTKPSLFVSDPTVTEASGTRYAEFDVSLSHASAQALQFSYKTVDGSAVAGSDYVGTRGVLTFEPGQTSATVRVAIKGDGIAEANEFFSLVLDPGGQAQNGFDASTGIAAIHDDDTGRGKLPILSAERMDVTEVNYGYLACTFKVSVTKPSSDEILFDYRALPGTTDAFDFSGSLPAKTGTIEAGKTSTLVTLYVDGDYGDEVDESVFLELFNAKNALLAGGEKSARTIGVIQDNDGSGSNLALFVNDSVVTEGASGDRYATFEVHLSRPHSEALSFKYKTVDGSARAASDYSAKSGTVSFAPGQTVAAVKVKIIGDQRLEQNEGFSLVLTPTAAIKNGTAGSTGHATIVNDDTVNEVIYGTAKANRLDGESGNDRIYGLAGDDKIFGGTGNDRLYGGSGRDGLSGGDGNDRIYGEAGNDRLHGGKGADKLHGGDGKKGLGKDTFAFTKLSDSTAAKKGQDTIYDFESGDRLDLSAIDANGKKSGNQAFTWIGTDKFQGKSGELRFEKLKSDTYVYADTNGDKKADMAIHLDDALKLAKGDFLL